MRTVVSLFLGVAVSLTAVTSFAWDFSCSPKEVTEIQELVPPNVLLMLDRSGSMGFTSTAHTVPRSCNLCRAANGHLFRVSNAQECLGNTWQNTRKKTFARNPGVSGVRYAVSVPASPSPYGIRATVEFVGDFDSSCEAAAIYADGQYVGRFNGNAHCGAESIELNIPSHLANDGVILVQAYTTSNSDCGGDGVALECGTNEMTVTLRNGPSPNQYLGQQPNRNLCGYSRKWDQAVSAINAVTSWSDQQNPVGAYFGLGYFSYGGASIARDCAPNGSAAIRQSLASNRPGGGTPTARAIYESRRSECLRDTFGATILINDGAPTYGMGGNARTDAIIQACQHRSVAPLFVVGLGSGTDQGYNNVLAAAGGTGTCVRNGVEVDPCASPASYNGLRPYCTGSIQTTGEQELVQAIGAITNSLGCVYPVNFDNSGVTDVPEDPTNYYDYFAVEMVNSSGSTVTVNHVSHPSSNGSGWDWSGDGRRHVVFTNDLCDLVNTGTIEEAATQLACLCQQNEGTTCSVPNHQALGVCPEGVWKCQEGIDFCEPDAYCCVDGTPCTVSGAQGVCAQGEYNCATESCDQTVFPTEEVCNNLDDDCDGIVDNISNEECTVPGAIGRCAVGQAECQSGTEVCVAVLGPQPELCNGLDDDCDGMTDNIVASWEKPQYSAYVLNEKEKACLVTDACVCNSGTDTHNGTDFASFVSGWNPVCECGSALEAGESDAPQTSNNAESKSAGCSTATTSGSGFGWMLIALIAARVRRRRE